jgi:hypothetical protein
MSYWHKFPPHNGKERDAKKREKLTLIPLKNELACKIASLSILRV